MFAKLLKHDFKSTWGVIGLLCLVSLGAGILGGGAMRYLVWIEGRGGEEMTVPTVLCILTMIVSILFIAVCGVGALFALIWRFYKSRFTDEGYLTFTLPVTSHQILLSSMVNSALNMLIVGITTFVSVMVLMLFGFSALDGFWTDFWEAIAGVIQDIAKSLTGREIGYLLQMLFAAIATFACELAVLMLSVTIGALAAKKHKILAAVGIYYGIHLALTVVNAVLLGTVVLTEAGSSAVATKVVWDQGLFVLLVGVCSYFLMHYLVSKKLNLN